MEINRYESYINCLDKTGDVKDVKGYMFTLMLWLENMRNTALQCRGCDRGIHKVHRVRVVHCCHHCSFMVFRQVS